MSSLEPNPSPTLHKNLASMGPGILSSIGVGVWRKALETFPDSNATLDTFQSPILGDSFLSLLGLTRPGRSTGKNQYW